LGRILLQSKPTELTAKRGTLEKLARQSQMAVTRQFACAALIIADGSIERTWKEVEAESSRLQDALHAILVIPDATLRATFYSKVEPLVRKAADPIVRRAAITAIVEVPGHEVETFKTLAALIESSDERPTAIRALQRIPQKFWPKETVDPLVRGLVDYLQNVPVASRTEVDFTDGLHLATDLASALPEEEARRLKKTLRRSEERGV